MTTVTADEKKYIQRGIPVSNGKLAMWLFLVTEIMFFTGLIGTYVVLRMGTPEGGWPEPETVHLVEALGAINTFVLIFSSFTVVMAHSAIMRGDSKKCLRYVIVTFVCGWVFMGIKAYEYAAKFEHGIKPGQMGDNIVDPALKAARDSGAPEYDHLNKPEYARYVDRAGKDPYDPNAAQWYKLKVKTKLTASIKPLMDEIKGAEAAATAEKKTLGEAERKAIVDKASEKDQAVFHLAEAIAGKPGQRPISALEVGVEANELNHKYKDLHLPPFIPYGNLWSSSYFAMTGFHAVHVIGGLVVFGIIMIHGLRGKLVPNAWNKSMLELMGLYWHFVDVVWIFLFPLLYLV